MDDSEWNQNYKRNAGRWGFSTGIAKPSRLIVVLVEAGGHAVPASREVYSGEFI